MRLCYREKKNQARSRASDGVLATENHVSLCSHAFSALRGPVPKHRSRTDIVCKTGHATASTATKGCTNTTTGRQIVVNWPHVKAALHLVLRSFITCMAIRTCHTWLRGLPRGTPPATPSCSDISHNPTLRPHLLARAPACGVHACTGQWFTHALTGTAHDCRQGVNVNVFPAPTAQAPQTGPRWPRISLQESRTLHVH